MNESRNIKVVSSRGKRAVELQTSVENWGELQSLLTSEGVELHNLKGIENINKTTLEKSSAVLPKGPFTLFLAPIKTSSGANTSLLNLSFQDLRKVLLEHGLKKEMEILFCSEDGRNWTQLKKEELITGLERLLPLDLEVAQLQQFESEKSKATISKDGAIIVELFKETIILLNEVLRSDKFKHTRVSIVDHKAKEDRVPKDTEEFNECLITNSVEGRLAKEAEEARLAEEFDSM